MSKVTLALGSFIVGAVLASLSLSVIHTSTRVQAEQGVDIVGQKPKIPPLSVRIHGSNFSGPFQPLDGIDCDGCTITAPLLTYAGGAFRCEGCTVRTNQVQLKGAADNTFKFLRLIGVIPAPPPNKTRPQNPPTLAINAQPKVTWVSLEGLPK